MGRNSRSDNGRLSLAVLAGRRIDRFRFPFVRIGRALAHDAAGAVNQHRAVGADLVRPGAGRIEGARVSVLARGRVLRLKLELERAIYREWLGRIAYVSFLFRVVDRALYTVSPSRSGLWGGYRRGVRGLLRSTGCGVICAVAAKHVRSASATQYKSQR